MTNQVETMKGYVIRLWHCKLTTTCRYETEDTGHMRAHLIKWHNVDPEKISHYGLSKHLSYRVTRA